MPTIYFKTQENIEPDSRNVPLGDTKERSTTDQTSSIITISESFECSTNLPSTTGEVLELNESTTA